MKKSTAFPSERDSLSLQFIELSQKVVAFGKMAGVRVRPYQSLRLPCFRTLSDTQKMAAVQSLKDYVDICQNVVDDEVDLQNSPQMIWRALAGLGLRPPPDLFSYLKSGDVVEIHNHLGIQIFRSFEFYEFCGYSLEELYSSPWNDLFEHERGGLNRLMEFSKSVFTGEIRNTVCLDWPEHHIEETRSAFRYQISAQFLFGAPLYNRDGNVAAHILVARGTLLNPNELDRYTTSQQRLAGV